MVPFADMFNHKAAVVQLAGGYFVEDVCMEGAESFGDEESCDSEDVSDGSGDVDVDDLKVCQNDAAGNERDKIKMKPMILLEPRRDSGVGDVEGEYAQSGGLGGGGGGTTT